MGQRTASCMLTYDRDLRDVVSVPDDLGQADVRQLGIAMPCEQDVGALQIHVHDPLGVQVVQTTQHVDADAASPTKRQQTVAEASPNAGCQMMQERRRCHALNSCTSTSPLDHVAVRHTHRSFQVTCFRAMALDRSPPAPYTMRSLQQQRTPHNCYMQT